MGETDTPLVISVSGRLDAAGAPLLDVRLCAAEGEHPSLLAIDMANATYISSSGLRVLLLAHRRQQARGGQFVLQHVPQRIFHVMQMCGFDCVFTIADVLSDGQDRKTSAA